MSLASFSSEGEEHLSLFWVDSERFGCTRELPECTSTNNTWNIMSFGNSKYRDCTEWLLCKCENFWFCSSRKFNLCSFFWWICNECFFEFSSKGEEHLLLFWINSKRFRSTSKLPECTSTNTCSGSISICNTRNLNCSCGEVVNKYTLNQIVECE